MVFQKIRVSYNFNQISWVSQSRFLSGSVTLAVSIFLQSCFGVSILVSQSKHLRSLGLAEKNASLAVSQTLLGQRRPNRLETLSSFTGGKIPDRSQIVSNNITDQRGQLQLR